jgi:hypothetical protein
MKLLGSAIITACLVSGLQFSSFSRFSFPSGDPLIDPDSIAYGALNTGDFAKPDYDVFEKAMTGYRRLKYSGKLSDRDILAIIDFRKSSSDKRLWVLDLKKKEILHYSLVAHGRNSGEVYPDRFSNKMSSYQSSLGFFITRNTYVGKHGISLRLQGVEEGINDLAEYRSIVMHGAEYVSESYVQKNGRLGRSFGCPAVPMEIHKRLIEDLKEGACLFIYYPDNTYRIKTKFKNLFDEEGILSLGKH